MRPAFSSALVAVALLPVVSTGCARVLTEKMLLHPPAAREHFSAGQMLVVDVAIDHDQPAVRALAEATQVIAPDGTPLRGWYFHSDSYHRNILFFHGSLGLMERSQRFLAWLSAYMQANVFAIDYRGYGYSEGNATIAALADDALVVFDDFAARRSPHELIFVFGYSLGTALAVQVAAQRDTAGVVLLSAFTSADEFCATAGPWWWRLVGHVSPAPPLCFIRQPIDNIRDVREPLLMIHGTDDLVTTLGLGREMFAAAGSQRKRMIEVPGGGHENIQLSRSPLREQIRAFFDAASPVARADK